VEEIVEVPGVGRRTAEAVVSALALQTSSGGVAVNTATGEILDQPPVRAEPPVDDSPDREQEDTP
jgi:excinuclease ABC subunit C